MSDSKPEGEGQGKPKIVVDEDWKAQAEAEKQRLAQQEKAAPAGAGKARELPRASFATLVSSQVTQILFALGALADAQGRRYRNLDIAKHHIDTLAVLEEKTKGNLTEDEKKLLDNALYEVRMAYVQAAQGPAGGGGGAR
ncbi:MAG TPA: DUF1844 domain-containing protein [Phycisphaerae bacterium]|nr:DUF1844 domain-containing protein [Phycisphaerae bacterium]